MGISSALGSSALLPAGLGFRNVLINGNMVVYQRGASSTTSLASSFACDRWNNFRGGAASGLTVSRQTAGLEGFQFCSRIQRDSGNTSTAALYFVQNIETVNSIPLAGKQVYLSFWARAGSNYSASGSVVRSSVEYATSTDSNYYTIGDGAATTVVSQNNTLTTAWQYFTMPATIAASQTQVFVAFKFTPVGTASTNDFFEITGVQLEQNYQPTPFEQRPFGVELALCQRYYYRVSQNASNRAFCLGWADSSTVFVGTIPFPQIMRTRPTALETTGTASDYAAVGPAQTSVATSVPAYDGTTGDFQGTIVITASGGGLTTGRGGQIRSNTTGTSFFAWSAEL